MKSPFARAVLWNDINAAKAGLRTLGWFLRREPVWAAVTGLLAGVLYVWLIAQADEILALIFSDIRVTVGLLGLAGAFATGRAVRRMDRLYNRWCVRGWMAALPIAPAALRSGKRQLICTSIGLWSLLILSGFLAGLASQSVTDWTPAVIGLGLVSILLGNLLGWGGAWLFGSRVRLSQWRGRGPFRVSPFLFLDGFRPRHFGLWYASVARRRIAASGAFALCGMIVFGAYAANPADPLMLSLVTAAAHHVLFIFATIDPSALAHPLLRTQPLRFHEAVGACFRHGVALQISYFALTLAIGTFVIESAVLVAALGWVLSLPANALWVLAAATAPTNSNLRWNAYWLTLSAPALLAVLFGPLLPLVLALYAVLLGLLYRFGASRFYGRR